MNKIILSFLFIFTQLTVNAQNARRFYNGLDLIFLSPDEAKTIPNEFENLVTWCKASVDHIYFSNLQRNINSRNSASFNSLDLILRRKFDFNFLDTGFILAFNKDLEKRETKVYTVNNNVWRIKSYNALIDLDTFNPENMTNNFYYMKILGSFTDEDLLANFINQTNDYRNYNDTITSTQRFIKAINQSQSLSIPEDLDKNPKFRLKDLCNAINKQVPNSNCTYPAYLSYIKNSDRGQNIANINKFYYPLLTRTLQDVMDVELLPEGSYEFYEQNVAIVLPKKYFKNSKSGVITSFNVRKIDYNVNYDFDKKSYYIDFTLTPHSNGLNQNFETKIRYKNFAKNKMAKKSMVIGNEKFKGLILRLYPEALQVFVRVTDSFYEKGTIDYELYKTISIH